MNYTAIASQPVPKSKECDKLDWLERDGRKQWTAGVWVFENLPHGARLFPSTSGL